MDQITANILIRANNRFYDQQAQSFGKTRQNSWPGWQRVLQACDLPAFDANPIRVLDLACGNKRFEAFLEAHIPDRNFQFTTVDNAPFKDIEGLHSNMDHRQIDVLDALLQEPTLGLDTQHMLSVSFGFMHHVPGFALRLRVLNSLLEATAPSGFVALSFWKFLDSPSLAQQAQASHEPACLSLAPYGLDPSKLDEGDTFLGWDGKPDVWRYCHSFTTAEIDQLIVAIEEQAHVTDRFLSDGRGQNLNEYVVLRKR